MDLQNKDCRFGGNRNGETEIHTSTPPELLAPAGSPEALRAAIAAGADAVYFGGADFSNRMRAKNFSRDEIKAAISLCRGYGVRCYLTVNTRVRDIERAAVLDFCRFLAESGADALIVADLGVAAAVTREILPQYPALELHASTQASLATALDGEALRDLGFTRMVVPRELKESDLRRVCRESPIEIETFIHGAHCVSYSGQCLMSWAMGGRSGNRGECAQPCRMTYTVSGETVRNESRYPLSLKDMCLAAHIPALISSGVASLKIEGRQKSAEYVYGATMIYRRLLDERRSATAEEMRYLDALFSRDGFTDGYFTGKHGGMLGVRSANEVCATNSQNRAAPLNGAKDAGKSFAAKFFGAGLPGENSVENQTAQFSAENSAENSAEYDLTGRRRRLEAEFTLKSGAPAEFTLTLDEISVSATGEEPERARGVSVTPETAAKNLTKFGGEPFLLAADDIRFQIEDGLYYPVSGLNALRRDALGRLKAALERQRTAARAPVVWPTLEGTISSAREKTCEVLDRGQITSEAERYFDRIYLPADRYEAGTGAKRCAILPAAVYDDAETESLLRSLAEAGCRRVMINTLSQLRLAREMGFTADGSFRLNITNSEALETWYALGLATAIVSPELKLPAIRDLRYPCGATVYGRIPLMLTERCFLSDGKCRRRERGFCRARLSDRRGEIFPAFSDGSCRVSIYNSRKIWMADRLSAARNVSVQHFMFTDETAAAVDRVVEGYRLGAASPEAQFRRIGG